MGTKTPGERLHNHASERSDYRIYIGVPAARPTGWQRVRSVTEDAAVTEGGDRIRLRDVTAFVVTYSNGQLVDAEFRGLRAPAGIAAFGPGEKRSHDVLTPEELRVGSRYVQISYGRSTAKPRDPSHYSTTLRNISTQKIRVTRFGGYTPSRRGWTLNTVTGDFYSAEEFREWYGLGEKLWLLPGQSATDSNNYGGLPVLWAYYCEAEDGTSFIAGAVLARPVQ